MLVTTPLGRVRAGKVALATNAFKPLLKRIEPLHRAGLRLLHGHRAAVERRSSPTSGGRNRQGLSATSPTSSTTTGLTEDNRILWGGYDAIYYWRGKVNAELESRPETWAKLSKHFFDDVPAARGSASSPTPGAARSTRAAGSACSGARRCRAGSPTRSATPGSASPRRRFGGEVMLDLLDGRRSRATQTDFVKEQAAAVPARAVPLRRHPGHPMVAGPRGPHRQAQPAGCGPSTAWASASTVDAGLGHDHGAADQAAFVHPTVGLGAVVE